MPRCRFIGCPVTKHVFLYHIVHELYFHLCIGHARLLSGARRSRVLMIEFLVTCLTGGSRPARHAIRSMILEESIKRLMGDDAGN